MTIIDVITFWAYITMIDWKVNDNCVNVKMFLLYQICTRCQRSKHR